MARKKKKRFGKTVVSFNLRMPEDLRSDLEEAAAVNDHSMNAEILWRLYDHIETAKGLARDREEQFGSGALVDKIRKIVEQILAEKALAASAPGSLQKLIDQMKERSEQQRREQRREIREKIAGTDGEPK
jgi:hypothetical protein